MYRRRREVIVASNDEMPRVVAPPRFTVFAIDVGVRHIPSRLVLCRNLGWVRGVTLHKQLTVFGKESNDLVGQEVLLILINGESSKLGATPRTARTLGRCPNGHVHFFPPFLKFGVTSGRSSDFDGTASTTRRRNPAPPLPVTFKCRTAAGG
jgi:hypothetical protein